jgi:hypothetical protein
MTGETTIESMRAQQGDKPENEKARVLGPADCVCITVGVTAHRNLSSVDTVVLRERVCEFFQQLRSEFPHLPIKLLNPLAEGGDRLVAEVALEMGIGLIIPLPMRREEYEKDFSSTESLAQFRALCEKGEITELSLDAANTEESISTDPAARARQYAQMGVYISSHSQILLALWDGEPTEKIGGTGSVVFFHLHDYMPGYLEPAATSLLLADNENDLVYHIQCRRESGALGFQPDPGRWKFHQDKESAGSMPQRYHAVFANLQALYLDAERYQSHLQRHLKELRHDRAAALDQELDTIEQLFVYADWLAVHFRKRVLFGLRITHIAAVLMGICFILFSEYDELFFLLPVFLGLFAFAWVLNRVTSARHWHRKYLDYRALAEGLRVQYYWAMAGVHGQGNTVLAYDNILQKQDVELVWIRHVMRNALVLRMGPGVHSEARLQQAIDEWIGEDDSVEGQLSYYQRTAASRQRQFQFTGRLGLTCLWLGITTAIILALAGTSLSDNTRNLLLVLIGVFPLIAGVREAYAFKKADRELVKQYRFMAQLFARARQRLAETDDADTRRNLLRALGDACLEEHAEWLLMHRERPLEHAGLPT